MKKLFIVSLALVFALASVSLYAGNSCKDRMDGKCKMMGKDGKCCAMCTLDANVKITNTKDGAVIELTAKDGGSDAKAIQEAVKSCCCFNKDKADKKAK